LFYLYIRACFRASFKFLKVYFCKEMGISRFFPMISLIIFVIFDRTSDFVYLCSIIASCPVPELLQTFSSHLSTSSCSVYRLFLTSDVVMSEVLSASISCLHRYELRISLKDLDTNNKVNLFLSFVDIWCYIYISNDDL
jgi:hypothetical protein